MRIIYFCLGWVMVALGVIGLVMPLMPGAVFLIVAAACFARSSPRFEAWLLEHPTLGKPLRDWRSAGAIPRPAKIMACAGMAIGFGVFCYTFAPSVPLALGVAAGFLACAAYVVSRPAVPQGPCEPGLLEGWSQPLRAPSKDSPCPSTSKPPPTASCASSLSRE
jgi:uncharacterized protein